MYDLIIDDHISDRSAKLRFLQYVSRRVRNILGQKVFTTQEILAEIDAIFVFSDFI